MKKNDNVVFESSIFWKQIFFRLIISLYSLHSVLNDKFETIIINLIICFILYNISETIFLSLNHFAKIKKERLEKEKKHIENLEKKRKLEEERLKSSEKYFDLENPAMKEKQLLK